jgi:HJR/Mrr/RecB family endonuclease
MFRHLFKPISFFSLVSGLILFATKGIKILMFIIIILAVAAGIVFLKVMFKLLKKLIDYIRYHASDITEIDGMDGIDFEHYLAVHFRKKGYNVTVTPPEHDYGVDLILKKGREKIAVQAKRYNFSKNYNVTYRAVQEVAAGMKYYGCNKGMVVTNSTFTKQATELARANNIEMWDRCKLISKFNVFDPFIDDDTELVI